MTANRKYYKYNIKIMLKIYSEFLINSYFSVCFRKQNKEFYLLFYYEAIKLSYS